MSCFTLRPPTKPAVLAITGTLPYIAPELLQSHSSSSIGSPLGATDMSSQAVDVYSFGVCLWETCTRLFPWRKLLEQGLVSDLQRRVGRNGERPPTDLGPGVRIDSIVLSQWARNRFTDVALHRPFRVLCLC